MHCNSRERVGWGGGGWYLCQWVKVQTISLDSFVSYCLLKLMITYANIRTVERNTRSKVWYRQSEKNGGGGGILDMMTKSDRTRSVLKEGDFLPGFVARRGLQENR